MKIAAFKGEVEVPNFNSLLVRSNILSWLQDRLKAAIQAADGFYTSRIRTEASQPSPATSSAPTAPKKRRNATDNNGVSKRAKFDGCRLTLVEYQPASGPKNTFVGLLCEPGYTVSAAMTSQIFNQLLGDLEQWIREMTFQIQNDNGTTLNGYASADVSAEVYVILDALSYPPFAALNLLYKANSRSTYISLEQTNFLKSEMQPNDLPRTPWVCVKSETNEFNKLLVGDNNRPDCLLYLPDRLPYLFYDLVERDIIYGLANNRYTPTPVPGAQTMPQKGLPFYAIQSNVLWSACLIKPDNTFTSEGVGGQGAMRCDPIAEYDSFAQDSGQLIGPALALLSQLSVGEATLYGSYMYKDVLPHQITYLKTYKVSAKKRNEPKQTRPLILDVPLKSELSKKTPQARMQMKLSGFTKKRKGPTGAGCQVANPVSSRLSANGVMLDDINTRFGSTLGNGGQDLGGWRGSATDLVGFVFAGDPVVRGFWANVSTGLKVLTTGSSAPPMDLQRIRTDQEWCHLLGHGDGGGETPDNFVAGSKHCNTEQLALELTQRIYRSNKLCVKVTAYLMPSALPHHQANWDKLKAAFPKIDTQQSGTGTTLDTLVCAPPIYPPANSDYKARHTDIRGVLTTFLERRANDPASTRAICILDHAQVISESFQTYKGMAPGAKKQAITDAAEKALAGLFPIIPIAWMMRYKVFVGSSGNKKVIDHIFHGQREEMDFQEFQVLQWLFRLKIAGGISLAEANEVIAMLKTKIPT
jgi:hypothetical protein